MNILFKLFIYFFDSAVNLSPKLNSNKIWSNFSLFFRNEIKSSKFFLSLSSESELPAVSMKSYFVPFLSNSFEMHL